MEPTKNSSGDKALPQRKNFMQENFDAEITFKKREEFAVSLRKQKTKSIIQAKRRKIVMNN